MLFKSLFGMLCIYLQEELSLGGYRRHQESQHAAPPLSHAELALKELHENEVQYMYRFRLQNGVSSLNIT